LRNFYRSKSIREEVEFIEVKTNYRHFALRAMLPVIKLMISELLIGVCWTKVAYADYKPVEFTDQSVLKDARSADVDLLTV